MNIDSKKPLPSYKNSPVYKITNGEYFETGMLVKENADGKDSEPYIYRDTELTISPGKIRTMHSGYTISMVLDEDEFEKGLRDDSFPLNSRLAFSTKESAILDNKNIVFGFLIGGQDVINKILKEKLLGESKNDIKIVSCYDPAYNEYQDDM
jgi:cyclophilin family peptidyl-prolyl cis-trans isomerase